MASGDGLAGECVEASAPDGGVVDDGGPPDAAMPADFAFRFGGVGSDSITEALPVSDGTIMVVGRFTGTLITDGMTLTSAGQSDLFVGKLRRDGSPVWLHRFGGTGTERPVDVVVDSNDSLVVFGNFNGETNLGGVTASSRGEDLFLMKIDQSGAVIWDHEYGGLGDELAVGLALVGSGDVIVLGSFDNFIDLGDGTQQTAGATDTFLARYAGLDGSVEWSERLGGTGSEEPLVISALGPNVAIAGRMLGQTNLGGGSQTFAQGGGFVSVYTVASGVYSWSHLIDAKAILAPLYFQGISILHDGSVVACVDFTGDIDFGGGEMSSTGKFFGRYRSGGSLQWSRLLGTAQGGVICGSVAASGDDHIFVAGQFGGVVDFGTDQVMSSENNHVDPFVAEFTADNEPVHAIAFHAAGGETVHGLAASPQVVVTGSFSGDLLLDDGATLTSVGASDSFVVGRVFP